MKKFLSDSKIFEFDRFYKECQKNNQPFIKARKNPIDDNYVVQLDLIPWDYNLSIEEQSNVKKLFEKETNYLKSNNPRNSVFKGCDIDKELHGMMAYYLKDWMLSVKIYLIYLENPLCRTGIFNHIFTLILIFS